MLNYFSLHERCFKLLDTIRSELHGRFVKYIGNPYMADQTTQLPFLVLNTFMVTMKRGEAAEMMHLARDFQREHGPRNEEVAVVNATLIKASEVVAQVVEEEGSAESMEIEKLRNVLGGVSVDSEQLDQIQEIDDYSEEPPAAQRLQPRRANRGTALESQIPELRRPLGNPPVMQNEGELGNFRENSYPSDFDSEI